MKTSQDPRHLRRVTIIKDLFAQSFTTQKFESPDTPKIIHAFDVLDREIQAAAPEWPLPKVAKVDLAVLRLATYELLIEKKTPPKVIIDEAVELAKEFGGESSAPFVNGVLGTILKNAKEKSAVTDAV